MTEKERRKGKQSGQTDEQPKVTAKNTTKEDRAFLAENAEGLSKTTVRYAKWIHTPDEHADKPGQTLATRSHEVIRAWAEERSGVPVTVPGTEHDDHLGVMRFDFTEDGDKDQGGSRLQEVGWEAFFRTFDERELVFLYQEQKADGTPSNFFRFDNPHREDG
jgi:hypothetical protein